MRKLIGATLLNEYGALGLLAGGLGSAAAIALTWAVSEHALKLNWHFIPSVNFLGVAVATALVLHGLQLFGVFTKELFCKRMGG